MKFEFPDNLTLAHHCLINTRWGDMDALGHLNNTIYFRYMESGRIAMLDAMSPNPSMPTSADYGQTGPVVVNAFCNFLAQVKHPAQLILSHWLGPIGRSSFDTYATMAYSNEPTKVVARGGATVVWVDFSTEKAVALPQTLREALMNWSSQDPLRTPPQLI